MIGLSQQAHKLASEIYTKAFKKIAEIEFKGEGVDEIGFTTSNAGIYDNLKAGDAVIAIDEFYLDQLK